MCFLINIFSSYMQLLVCLDLGFQFHNLFSFSHLFLTISFFFFSIFFEVSPLTFNVFSFVTIFIIFSNFCMNYKIYSQFSSTQLEYWIFNVKSMNLAIYFIWHLFAIFVKCITYIYLIILYNPLIQCFNYCYKKSFVFWSI